MYSASQRKVGEYNNRVFLEVGTEFFSYYPKDQCRLLKMSISSFCLDRDLLIENMGLCFRCSSSLNNVALTKTS